MEAYTKPRTTAEDQGPGAGNSGRASVATQYVHRSEQRLNKGYSLTYNCKLYLKKLVRKVENMVNVSYIVANDKPDNLNGYPSNQFYPYIYRAGGVSHWDRCLSLFTRSSRHFFAPTSRLPLSANFLTSKNNDK